MGALESIRVVPKRYTWLSCAEILKNSSASLDKVARNCLGGRTQPQPATSRPTSVRLNHDHIQSTNLDALATQSNLVHPAVSYGCPTTPGGDYHFDPQTNVIEVHISRLRSKIDKGHKQALLHTVRGEGYVLRDDADHQCESLRNVVKVDSEGIESDIRS